jgi:hypothetical protein
MRWGLAWSYTDINIENITIEDKVLAWKNERRKQRKILQTKMNQHSSIKVSGVDGIDGNNNDNDNLIFIHEISFHDLLNTMTTSERLEIPEVSTARPSEDDAALQCDWAKRCHRLFPQILRNRIVYGLSFLSDDGTVYRLCDNFTDDMIQTIVTNEDVSHGDSESMSFIEQLEFVKSSVHHTSHIIEEHIDEENSDQFVKLGVDVFDKNDGNEKLKMKLFIFFCWKTSDDAIESNKMVWDSCDILAACSSDNGLLGPRIVTRGEMRYSDVMILII